MDWTKKRLGFENEVKFWIWIEPVGLTIAVIMLETWGGQIWNQIKIENFKDLQIKQENKKCTTSLFMQKKEKENFYRWWK